MTLPRDFFENLVRHLKPDRRWAVGNIWWVDNRILHIPDPNTQEHPVLIVRALTKKGVHVGIAPGSSSRLPQPGDSVLPVAPRDLEDGSMAKPLTRFFLDQVQPLPPEKLAKWIGRITNGKIEELKLRLRRTI